MKFIRKINIGLILTMVVVLAVVIYSICVENGRKVAKEDIKKSIDNFISVTDKYCILPEEHQVVGVDAGQISLNEYYGEMENELKKCTTTEQTAKIQKQILSEMVEDCLLDTSNIMINFDRKIAKIKSYAFDGNQVTVTFSSRVTTKQKYQDVDPQTGELGEKIREDYFDNSEESITLELKDGMWKVVCADFNYINYEDVKSSNTVQIDF